MRIRIGAAALGAALLVAAGCQSPEPARTVQLYPGFEGYARTVTTDSPEAQAWFDQGIQILYGFNHDEAIRSFQRAADIDPGCAMAWWGVAYANGLHINNPEMTEHQSREGYHAAQRALAALDDETPVERALVEAVAVRYAMPIPEDRMPLDEAYAARMEAAWERFPNDPDVGALFAESLMNLQPWDYWEKDGSSKGRIDDVVATLERVIEIDPDHPGANHFYIHAVEASNDPERGLASAKRLETLVPGSGHLVHMPGHIYLRIGRYADASDANVAAINADNAYFALAPEPEFYGLYYVHNYHFLTYAAMMECRRETAMTAARDLEANIPPEFLKKYPQFADAFMPTPRHVMIRFGEWDEVLEEPAPPSWRRISVLMHHYARGVSLAALGRPEEARRELASFDRAATRIPEDWMVGNNAASVIVPIARCMLEGEILFREGDHDEAFARLREGVALEDELIYDEPPGWMQPVRHALGALLMASYRFEEAERVYREDLIKHPRNGWALLGLENALRAQGRENEPEVARLAEERAAAWRRADVKPTSSCFCEPAGWVSVE